MPTCALRGGWSHASHTEPLLMASRHRRGAAQSAAPQQTAGQLLAAVMLESQGSGSLGCRCSRCQEERRERRLQASSVSRQLHGCWHAAYTHGTTARLCKPRPLTVRGCHSQAATAAAGLPHRPTPCMSACRCCGEVARLRVPESRSSCDRRAIQLLLCAMPWLLPCRHARVRPACQLQHTGCPAYFLGCVYV